MGSASPQSILKHRTGPLRLPGISPEGSGSVSWQGLVSSVSWLHCPHSKGFSTRLSHPAEAETRGLALMSFCYL